MAENSFHKVEKLKSRKSIESLFKYGKTFSSPPLKLLYRPVEPQGTPAKIGVAVPKRLIKRAVDRNLIKRRMREAYRLNKGTLTDSIDTDKEGYEVLFLFQAGEPLPFKSIQSSMRFLLTKLAERISKQ